MTISRVFPAPRVLRRAVLAAAVLLAVLSVPQSASAGTLTFIPPSSSDFQDLDHHYVYTWLIRNINTVLPGGTGSIIGASLTFNNIRNWTDQPNRLYLALLDTSETTTATSVSNNNTTLLRIGNGNTGGNTNVSSSIYRIQDDPNLSNNNVTFRDELAKDTTGSSEAGYYTPAGRLMIPDENTGVTALGNQFQTRSYTGFGTDYQYLTAMQEGWVRGATGDPDESFGTQGETFTLDFNATAITNLISYINNGNDIALGLDPDCHFYNDGIVFTIYTQDFGPSDVVPEPATMTLFGLGLAALYYRRRRTAR